MASDIVKQLHQLFATRGADEYHGEAVSQLEHALQSAWLAEQEGASDEIVIAALLHDVGHLLGNDSTRENHEMLGYRYLAKWFGPNVTEPIRYHVAAKRYLCFSDANYRQQLSPASIQSLHLQGGAMSADEAREFERHPQFTAIVNVRRWDDRAKQPDLPTPDFGHFCERMERVKQTGR